MFKKEIFLVFLVKEDKKTLLDVFRTYNSARIYADSFKHLKIDGEIIIDNKFVKEVKNG